MELIKVSSLFGDVCGGWYSQYPFRHEKQILERHGSMDRA
jgi:hypothetical protein